jgi:type IV pilus assembly protein PilW
MSMNRIIANCRGLTLVELMISMVLSLMIMGGAISIFMGSKETFRLEEDLSRTQENFRFIADRLTKDLSLVGYTGCPLPYDDNSSTVDNRLEIGGKRDVIEGTEGGSPTKPDSLTITYAKPASSTHVLTGSAADSKAPINISTNSDLYKALQANLHAEAKQAAIPLLVTNCDGGDIFVVTGIDEHDASDSSSPSAGQAGLRHETGVEVGGIANAEASFRVPYGDINSSAAKIYYTEEVTYEVCTDTTGITGLCVTRTGRNREMLIPEVTNFQVKYGLDAASSEDGNADHYVDWPGTAAIPDITSIKVTLTMVLNQVGGNDVTKVYSFTVKLRNMGLNV